MKQYNEYNGIKLKCGIARKEAYRLRDIYTQCVQEWEGSIRKLQMAKRQQRRRGGGGIATATAASSRGGRKMKKSKKEGSGDGDIIEGGGGVAGTNTTIAARDEGVEGEGGDGMLRGDDGITTTTTTSYSTATTTFSDTATTTSPSSWSTTLRQLGTTYNISKQCESVIHAYDDMVLAQSNYTQAVLDENTAVEEAMAIEKMALDSVQHLEEVSDLHYICTPCPTMTIMFVCIHSIVTSLIAIVVTYVSLSLLHGIL